MTDSRSTLLICCKALGWLLAGMIVVGPGIEIADQLHHQALRSAVTKQDFMRRVRDCVHGRSGPVRSWETCEVVARDSE